MQHILLKALIRAGVLQHGDCPNKGKKQPFIGEVREIRQWMIFFLLIEKDKVWFGRYRISLAFADTVPLSCSSNPLQSRQGGLPSLPLLPSPPLFLLFFTNVQLLL